MVLFSASLMPCFGAKTNEDDLSGFTVSQLDTAVHAAGLKDQKLYSIRTFDSKERAGAYVAILSGSHSGWRVTILKRVVGGLKVQWHSGRLSSDFDVSDTRNLRIESVEDEQIAFFSGCAAHMCGGITGDLGMMLYSPETKQVFFAHYRYPRDKPIGTMGTIEYSENAAQPRNERYRKALQDFMETELK